MIGWVVHNVSLLLLWPFFSRKSCITFTPRANEPRLAPKQSWCKKFATKYTSVECGLPTFSIQLYVGNMSQNEDRIRLEDHCQRLKDGGMRKKPSFVDCNDWPELVVTYTNTSVFVCPNLFDVKVEAHNICHKHLEGYALVACHTGTEGITKRMQLFLIQWRCAANTAIAHWVASRVVPISYETTFVVIDYIETPKTEHLMTHNCENSSHTLWPHQIAAT